MGGRQCCNRNGQRYVNGLAYLLVLYSNLAENLVAQFTQDSEYSYVALYFLFLGIGVVQTVVEAITRPALQLAAALLVEGGQTLALILLTGASRGRVEWQLFVFLGLFVLQAALCVRQYLRQREQPARADAASWLDTNGLASKVVMMLSAVGLPTLFLFFDAAALQRTSWFETIMTVLSTIVAPALKGFIACQVVWMRDLARRRALVANEAALAAMQEAVDGDGDDSPLKLPMPFRVHFSLLFNAHHGLVGTMYLVTIVNLATWSGSMPEYDRVVSIVLIAINSLFFPCILLYFYMAWAFLRL